MARKYIRISKEDLKSILTDAVAKEIEEIGSMGVNPKLLMAVMVTGASIVKRTLDSLPGEVYESDVVDFPNSN